MIDPDSIKIQNRQPAVVEAGELYVPKNDVVPPSKLMLLAAEGWSLVDAWKLDEGGFKLLVIRNDEADKKIHAGTARCPQYCGCM